MTTLVEQVADRLDAEVEALKGRVEFAAEFAALVEAGVAPKRDVSAFVLPLGFDATGGGSAATAFTQMLSKTIAVVLVIRAPGDAKAKRAVPTIDVLEKAIVDVIAGWAPDEAIGVFEVTRGRLVSVNNGLVFYQLEFQLSDQLRIV